MKAWQVAENGDPESALEMVEVPIPEPGPGDVQLEVVAAGIGLPDVLLCRGRYAFAPALPFTPGQEVAGVVSAVGEGVALRKGDQLMGVTAFYAGHGGFATHTVAPVTQLYPWPAGMPPAEAAAFCIPYHTAWIGLVERARLQAGETLLVLGAAGGSGAAAVQLGRALGAEVIAVAGGAEKSAYCRDIGAQQVIDYRAQDVRETVLAMTGGGGVDVVFDPVGGELFDAAVACTGNEGRLLAVGFASGDWGQADTRQLVNRNCAVLGVYVGAYDHQQVGEFHQKLLDLYSRGLIHVPLAGEVAFDEVPSGLSRLQRRQVRGKLIVRIQ